MSGRGEVRCDGFGCASGSGLERVCGDADLFGSLCDCGNGPFLLRSIDNRCKPLGTDWPSVQAKSAWVGGGMECGFCPADKTED